MNRLITASLTIAAVLAFGGDAHAGNFGDALNNAQPTSKQMQYNFVCHVPGYGPCNQRGHSNCRPQKGANGQITIKCDD